MFKVIIKKIARKIFYGNNIIGLPLYFLKNSEYKQLVKRNIKFKDSHLGERCFILGNGPSLNAENLEILKDEYVFSVNQFNRNPIAKQVRPNFHFWADSNFFDVDFSKEENKEMLQVMKTISECNSDVEVFFPVQQKAFVSRYKLNETMNVNYFLPGKTISEHTFKLIDFTKFTPGFGTVVQWAISMAIYMGFTDIYILGCDNTGLIVNMKSLLRENDDTDYSYHVSDNEKKRLESLLQRNSLEAFIRAYLSNIIGYRWLAEYCLKKGIKLVNCSSVTLIDSIPRARFSDVIKENQTGGKEK